MAPKITFLNYRNFFYLFQHVTKLLTSSPHGQTYRLPSVLSAMNDMRLDSLYLQIRSPHSRLRICRALGLTVSLVTNTF